MKFLIFFSAAVLVASGLSACNTIRGFGEDISALGHALSKSSGTNSETR
jgi:predicted small secreted protein